MVEHLIWTEWIIRALQRRIGCCGRQITGQKRECERDIVRTNGEGKGRENKCIQMLQS